MGYTCSFDCSCRVKKSGVGGYLYHLYRDLYEEQNHSNENIKSELTKDNISLVYDDESGGLKHPENVEELNKLLFNDVKAYENAGGKIRKDAVYLRPIMMELGNGFYDDFPQGLDDKHKELDLMYNWACNTWGKENVRGVVCHLDEVDSERNSKPHVHTVFLVSSVREAEDGTLTMNQKNIINGKGHLKSLHKSFRAYMKDCGLDVRMENLENSHPHYKDDEYKRMKDWERDLDGRETQVAERETKQATIQATQEAIRQKQVEATEINRRNKAYLDKVKAKLDQRAQKLKVDTENWEREKKATKARLETEIAKTQAEREALREAREVLYSKSEVLDGLTRQKFLQDAERKAKEAYERKLAEARKRSIAQVMAKGEVVLSPAENFGKELF